jgi:NADH-quinone oxidoreductase subunit F
MSRDLSTLRRRAEAGWRDLHQGERSVITVGTATCGRAAGSMAVLQRLREESTAHHLDCDIVEVGCIGMCYAEPIVSVAKPGHAEIYYGNVDTEKASELVEGYLVNDKLVADGALGTLGKDRVAGIPRLFETPMLRPQVRRVLQNCGLIDPSSIDHSLANDGYSGLDRALRMYPFEIVQEVKESGLRGRGGAGFPTWRKWTFCREADEKTRYLVCNADEGDPGAFMNRSLIEGDPHTLLEGMAIAGYAMGISKAYVYCRAEYPLALERLRAAIGQAEDNRLLGRDILGSGFDFDIEVREGAGAFVCGEETALIGSLEGRRGIPRPRPPFPATSGLWGKPTVINNVETLANVALILRNGAEWFAQCGTEDSRGTKTFSLVGNVKRAGLIEVPLGITLREIIYGIGGGILGNKQFKAVQTGGPSGGCLPAELLDTHVDYDSLRSAGSIMGSGGMVVMDEDNCMVDIARYFQDFTQRESCGKCAPCRLGTKQMLDILEDITHNRGKPGDIDLLVEIAESVQACSLCGLGQTAPNPVLTTIRYFRDEYEAHINHAHCPAMVCSEFVRYRIVPELCVGCQLCAKACPQEAIAGDPKKPHTIDQSKCVHCGICFEVCPSRIGAVERVTVNEVAKAA